MGVKLGVNEEKILKNVIKNRFVTIAELSKTLEISTTAVENNLTKLKQKGFIQRVGSDKTGHWEIRKK